jgi:hypothetical protein
MRVIPSQRPWYLPGALLYPSLNQVFESSLLRPKSLISMPSCTSVCAISAPMPTSTHCPKQRDRPRHPENMVCGADINA